MKIKLSLKPIKLVQYMNTQLFFIMHFIHFLMKLFGNGMFCHENVWFCLGTIDISHNLKMFYTLMNELTLSCLDVTNSACNLFFV